MTLPKKFQNVTATSCDVEVGDVLSRITLHFEQVLPRQYRCVGREYAHDASRKLPINVFLEVRGEAVRRMQEQERADNAQKPEIVPGSVTPTGCEVKVGVHKLRFERERGGNLTKVGRYVPITSAEFQAAFQAALAAVVGAADERTNRNKRRVNEF